MKKKKDRQKARQKTLKRDLQVQKQREGNGDRTYHGCESAATSGEERSERDEERPGFRVLI